MWSLEKPLQDITMGLGMWLKRYIICLASPKFKPQYYHHHQKKKISQQRLGESQDLKPAGSKKVSKNPHLNEQARHNGVHL
jgi:hypothetical protein